jgi:hypothetical protein
MQQVYLKRVGDAIGSGLDTVKTTWSNQLIRMILQLLSVFFLEGKMGDICIMRSKSPLSRIYR